MRRLPSLGYAIVVALGLVLGYAGARLAAPVAAVAPAPPTPPEAAPTIPVESEHCLFSASSQEPTSAPDLLPAGAPAIHAFYQMNHIGTGQRPRGIWYRNGKRIGEVPEVDIHPDPAVPGRGTVVLRPPQGKFSAGIYELDLISPRHHRRSSCVVADGASAILQQPAPREAALTIPRMTTARGVTARGEPVHRATSFGARERIYVVLRYEGAEPGTAIVVRWRGGGTELPGTRQEVTLPGVSGWVHAWIEVHQGLPPGAYTAMAYAPGDLQALATAAFAVR